MARTALTAGGQRLRVIAAYCPDKKTDLAQRLLVVYTFCPDKKIRNPAKALEMADPYRAARLLSGPSSSWKICPA